MTKKRIKVLETIRQGLVGGGETHVYDLSTHLDTDKFEPIVLSFTEGPMVDRLRDKGIQVYVIPTTVPFDPRITKKVLSLLKELNIDMVHAHGTRAASNMLQVCRKLNIPLMYTVHGWSFNDSQRFWVRKLRVLAEQYICNRVSKVVCVSESNRQTGIANIRGFESEVINNGISLCKFTESGKRDVLRDSMGFGEDEVWVGFIARLTYQKDPLTLLKAFNQAWQKNDRLRLLMVGEGEMGERVDSFIKENSLEKYVRRMPFQSNVPELLEAIDIYTLVSRWEGLPIGLLEAMAMSKPIIASDVDGTREIIKNGENGFLVLKEEVSRFADALVNLASDQSLRIKFGLNSKKEIEEHFSLGVMVSHIERVYLGIMV